MKKTLLVLIVLSFLLATSLFSFEIVPTKAMVLGANLGIGHGIGAAAEFELPPYGGLEFLKFIPGFGMDLQLGLNDGFFVQNAVCVRVKPMELPLYAKAGLGVGIRLGGAGIYIPVVLGADYFLTEKLAATTSMTFGDGFRLTLGIGLGFGFSKEE